MLGGEGVGGDLGPGAGEAAEQRALAGVGHADQADVGDQLQFQPHGADLARLAGRRLPRGPIGGRLETVIAFAALAAAGHHDLVAFLGQVFQYVAVFGVDDHGARRNGDRKILAGGPVAVGAGAVLARLGLPRLAMGEHGEAIDAFAGDEDHAAAVAAVAAVGSAQRHVLLPPEADATVAPLARLETNDHFIDKHRSP